jgi:pimeloyl-ACP methyl ester carboxylesterase
MKNPFLPNLPIHFYWWKYPKEFAMTQRRIALNGETLQLDDDLRKTIPGTFVKLPDGMTWYELAGPANGQIVVFLNGYSVPHYLWDHTFQPLADAGFRVLRFDHFGRGWSDRPNVEYGPDLFDRQIIDLLQALDIKSPINLVGSSMGGLVAAIFADRHPERVDKLVLIDAAGMMPPPTFPNSLLMQPILGELIMHLTGDRTLPTGMAGDLLYPDLTPEYVTNYLPQMKIIGFKRAILSTLRTRMLFDSRPVYKRLGQTDQPILMLWGDHDLTIPMSVGLEMLKLLPRADWRTIEETGHVPHYELPDVVNAILVEFLK